MFAVAVIPVDHKCNAPFSTDSPWPGPPDSPFPFRRHRYAGALQADPPDIPLAGMPSRAFLKIWLVFSLKEDPPEIYTNILHTTHSVQTLQKAWNWWKLHSNCDAQAISPGAHTTTHDLRASDSNPLAHSDFTKSSSWIAGIATSFYESWKPLFTKHVIVFIEVLGRDWKSLVFGA